MRSSRTRKRPSRLKWKLLLLAGAVILLAGSLFFQMHRRNKELEAYENQKKEVQEPIEDFDVPESGTEKPDMPEVEIEVPKEEEEPFDEAAIQGGQEPEGSQDVVEDSGALDKPSVPISNLNEYAAQVMGENSHLLEESLASWIEEKHLTAAGGSIFHVMVPESDPQSIQYYIKLDDEKASLVMLAYHPRENVVTASICNYTEEEILQEVWEDNGPLNRDVTPEEENLPEEIPAE